MNLPNATTTNGAPDSGHDLKFQLLDRALKKHQYRQDALIEVLHAAQESFGHLDEEVLDYISLQLQLPPSWVYGVATFYNFFTLNPQGEHICVVCLGTACYVKGGGEILARLEQEFSVKADNTTADGTLSLMTARCLGNCSLAPLLTLDGEVLGKTSSEAAIATLRSKAARTAVQKEESA